MTYDISPPPATSSSKPPAHRGREPPPPPLPNQPASGPSPTPPAGDGPSKIRDPLAALRASKFSASPSKFRGPRDPITGAIKRAPALNGAGVSRSLNRALLSGQSPAR